MNEKQCARCKETKPLTEFHTNVRRSDGKHTICKACNCQASMEWQRRNRERRNLSARNWYRKKKRQGIDGFRADQV